jgi:hypothetical protein
LVHSTACTVQPHSRLCTASNLATSSVVPYCSTGSATASAAVRDTTLLVWLNHLGPCIAWKH